MFACSKVEYSHISVTSTDAMRAICSGGLQLPIREMTERRQSVRAALMKCGVWENQTGICIYGSNIQGCTADYWTGYCIQTIPTGIKNNRDLKIITIPPATNVAVMTVLGDYYGLYKAHSIMENYLRMNNYLHSGPVCELFTVVDESPAHQHETVVRYPYRAIIQETH